MKKIAIFILLLFTLNQALPTAQSLLEADNIMLVDYAEEHKSNTEDLKEKNESKDFIKESNIHLGLILSSFHRPGLSEDILPIPTLDKLTPPPNFC